jgi:hypothetical protein
MREPQEIEDRPAEQAVARVAAVDVAKASGVVCSRVPREGEPGRFVTRVWTADATTNAILELADHLAGLRIEKAGGNAGQLQLRRPITGVAPLTRGRAPEDWVFEQVTAKCDAMKERSLPLPGGCWKLPSIRLHQEREAPNGDSL